MIEPDRYQRPPGTPEPEGGTSTRSPFPGWLRNLGSGWNGRVNPRKFKAAILNHQIDRGGTSCHCAAAEGHTNVSKVVKHVASCALRKDEHAGS